MLTKEFLQEQYINNNKSTYDIAKEFNIKDAKVLYWLKKYKFEIRKRSDYNKCAPNLIDLTGQVFSYLTVIRRIKGDKSGAFWECRCVCGKLHITRSKSLRVGDSKSCGCKRIRKYKDYKNIHGSYWNSLKKGADKRNLDFNITIKYAWKLFEKQNRTCALTGVDIHLEINYHIKKDIQTASLDRIDPTKGYIRGNVQWIHKNLNWMKMDFQQEEFIKICNQVAKTHPR